MPHDGHNHGGGHLKECLASLSSFKCRCEIIRYKRIIWIDIIVFCLGISVALILGSATVFADATHSLQHVGEDTVIITIARRVLFIPERETFTRAWGSYIQTLLLFAASCFVFAEAYLRFENPLFVNPYTALAIGTVSTMSGIFKWYIFERGGKKDHDTHKNQILHIAADLVTSIGVVLVGISFLLFPSFLMVDPIVASVMGAIIFLLGIRAFARTRHSYKTRNDLT